MNANPDPEWYHQAYLKKIGQLNKWLDHRTTDQVFGPQGFHYIVTGFVAVYRPSIQISTSSSSLSTIKQAAGGSGGISIGPFGFSASGSGGSSKFDLSEGSGDITITSQTTGRLLGFL